MAKEAAVFWWVSVREGSLFVLIVTVETEFFSVFFAFHIMKRFMDLVVGKVRGCFFGSIEQENEDTYANTYKEYI